ncbi:ATP-binding protein [Streptomyces sp. NPDC004082]|uniref:ATP-binding protein n=1 Tax=unclassified Streptomyces TaxID=2593676 RepID=UPI0033B82566
MTPVRPAIAGTPAPGGTGAGQVVSGDMATDRVDGVRGGPVPGGRGSTLTPEHTVTTATAAREQVRAVVRERWDSGARRASAQAVVDLLLVTSELVTNAVRHGRGVAGFEVTDTADGLRLTVRDNSDVVPLGALGSSAMPGHHLGHGYGWPLIIRLARDITVERCPGGGKAISVVVPLTGDGEAIR